MAGRLVVALAAALLLAGELIAQEGVDYTIIALSHTDNMVSEHEPMSGRVLNRFVVEGEWYGEVHEGTITRDGTTMYVSVPYSKYVLILDLDTFTERGRIESAHFSRPETVRRFARIGERSTTTSDPHGVAVSRDGRKVYVSVEYAEVPGVVVYDIRTGRSHKIETVVAGNCLGAHPDTDKLYFPTRDDRVVVIDTNTDRIVRVIPVQGAPNGVDFAPNGEVWFNGNRDGSVTVVDPVTDTVVKVIQTTGRGNGRVAVSPDGRLAAATQGPQVTVIDARTKEILHTLKTTETGQGFPLFSPDSRTLFIMNELGNDIVVFDMRSMTEISRYPVGGAVFGGGIRRR